MGYVARDTGTLRADASRGISRDRICSEHQIEELRLDTESIIFEMTPEGWSATKLTKLGWFRGSADTIGEAADALCAEIRAALATN
jgi:hypothetical protein